MTTEDISSVSWLMVMYTVFLTAVKYPFSTEDIAVKGRLRASIIIARVLWAFPNISLLSVPLNSHMADAVITDIVRDMVSPFCTVLLQALPELIPDSDTNLVTARPVPATDKVTEKL